MRPSSHRVSTRGVSRGHCATSGARGAAGAMWGERTLKGELLTDKEELRIRQPSRPRWGVSEWLRVCGPHYHFWVHKGTMPTLPGVELRCTLPSSKGSLQIVFKRNIQFIWRNSASRSISRKPLWKQLVEVKRTPPPPLIPVFLGKQPVPSTPLFLSWGAGADASNQETT